MGKGLDFLPTFEGFAMHIQINTDHNLDGQESFAEPIRASLAHALRHVATKITRLEVHLSDENGAKTGQRDQRCMLEARLQGRQPVACTAHAATVTQAVQAAADKLLNLLETELGRQNSDARQAGPVVD